MSDPTVRVAERVDLIAAETAEGLQGLQPRKTTGTDELGREVGAVLRTSDLTLDPNDVNMWTNSTPVTPEPITTRCSGMVVGG